MATITAGHESGWHMHPGEEVGYIVAGTVQMEIRDRATVVLHACDPFLIPPRTPHNALDLGPENGRMLSTYIVHGVTMRLISDAILLDHRLISQVLEAPALLPSLREWLAGRAA